MSYEAELDYYQKYVEPALIRREQKLRVEKKKDLERLEANMPPKKMQQKAKLRKVAGGWNE